METVPQEMGLGVNRFLQLAGTAKATYYRRKQGIPASPSTVYCLMKRFGRLQQSPRRGGYRYSPPPRPERMGLTMGLDFTRWGKDRLCNVIKYQSRYCLAAVATLTEDAQAASNALGQAILQTERLKLPTQGIEVKSDQGTAFKAKAFTEFLEASCWGQTLSAVGKPQGMGRVERFHRTLEVESLQYEEVESLDEPNRVLESFREDYNTRRPHQALDYKTPLEVIRSAQETGIV
ncbi:integrase core domain-containing protein [Meiothermus sp.]|uniref:integrase core domain-containing protein n=1 Tax=Meiothermus sp. TaxID=1955249 RepID=UPI00307D1F35